MKVVVEADLLSFADSRLEGNNTNDHKNNNRDGSGGGETYNLVKELAFPLFRRILMLLCGLKYSTKSSSLFGCISRSDNRTSSRLYNQIDRLDLNERGVVVISLQRFLTMQWSRVEILEVR